MPVHTTDDGCRLAFSVEGPAGAPLLVLSNSLGTDRSLWDRQIDQLIVRYRVLRYDTRGHGESGAPSGDYTIDRLGQDVLSLLDAVGVARAHVCGISIGGMTALWLGANAPERVHRLVLANTAARIGSVELWSERIRVATTEGLMERINEIESTEHHGSTKVLGPFRRNGPLGYRTYAPLDALADAAMGRWFTSAFRAAEPDTVARFRSTMSRMRVDGYVGCCAALRDADLHGVASRARAKCLVVTGQHDLSTPPVAGKWLAETVPGAELLTLDAAHLSNVERAAEFTAAIDLFLKADS